MQSIQKLAPIGDTFLAISDSSATMMSGPCWMVGTYLSVCKGGVAGPTDRNHACDVFFFGGADVR